MNRYIKAARAWDSVALEHLLASGSYQASYTDQSGRTGLHHVAGQDARKPGRIPTDAVASVDALLDAGADIDAVQEIPETDTEVFLASAVWYAYCRGHNAALAKYLLSLGANPHSCLWAAAWNNDDSFASTLLNHGAEVDPVIFGETPFLHAAKFRRFRAATLLIKNGANVNHADHEGNTALHFAVAKRFPLRQIATLLDFGADPRLHNRQGQSSIALAQSLSRTRLVRLLNDKSRSRTP